MIDGTQGLPAALKICLEKRTACLRKQHLPEPEPVLSETLRGIGMPSQQVPASSQPCHAKIFRERPSLIKSHANCKKLQPFLAKIWEKSQMNSC